MEPYLYLNGMTSGIFLDYNIKATYNHISDIVDVAIRISEDELIINQEAVDHEIQIIDFENKNPQWRHGWWANMNKYYTWVKDWNSSRIKSFDDIKKLYNDIIINRRVSVVFRGNPENPQSLETVEKLRKWLKSRTIEKKKFEGMYESLPYTPNIQLSTPDGNNQKMTVYFSFDKVNKDVFAYYYFFVMFFNFVLEEYVREIDESDYWVKRNYRTSSYSALQLSYTMHSSSSSNIIERIANDFFHKNKDDFELLKNKVVEKEEIFADDPWSVYQIIHSQYFYRWKYRPVDSLVESLKKINFEDFYEFYMDAITRMSIEIE